MSGSAYVIHIHLSNIRLHKDYMVAKNQTYSVSTAQFTKFFSALYNPRPRPNAVLVLLELPAVNPIAARLSSFMSFSLATFLKVDSSVT